jgi:hypothetical protein
VENYGIVRQATDDGIIRRMHFACWVTKATNTLTMCNTANPRQQWLRERVSVSRYTCIACLVSLNMHMKAETSKQVSVAEASLNILYFVDRASCNDSW